MNFLKYMIDEEGIHSFFLNEYHTKFYMIRLGGFQNRTLITVRFEQPNGHTEVDFLLTHDEKAADLEVAASGEVSEELGKWIEKSTGQRYYILGAFIPEKLLDTIGQEIEGYVNEKELPADLFEQIYFVLNSYMRNPLNHRTGIQ